MQIDKEFKSIIPKLTAEEYAELEKSIVAEGCRDAISLWSDIIIDGHNRYEICKKHNIPYKTKVIKLEDRDAVLVWMINNQFGRRNLNKFQRAELALRLEEVVAAQAKARQVRKPTDDDSVKATLPEQKQTRDIIGKQAGVGGRTIDKVKVIQTKATPEVKEKLRDGELTINKAFTDIKKVEKKEAKAKAREEAKEENIKLPDFVKIEHGDCLKLSKSLKDNSISLIVTDPPYPEEFIDCWTKLGKIAMRTLKPSGFVIAYSGQMHLDKVIERMKKEGLIYYWTMALTHSGPSSTIHPRATLNGWKPVLVFQKPPLKKSDTYFKDVIKGSGKEKDGHEWQQGEAELKQIFDVFYTDGTVLEPFSGSGTTLSYCKKAGIKCVGYEIDEDSYKECLMRLGDK